MELFHIFILVGVKILVSTATEILYVLPDNSTDAVSCPSQPCATLSQYLSVNGTLPVVSNVEYHFLPGEHHVPANMTLQNLHNFSIIGFVSKTLSPIVLVGCCSQPYVISITYSYFVTIDNVMFKLNTADISPIYKMQSTNLMVSCCFSCQLKNIKFLDYGVIGYNLIGESYLYNIKVKPLQSLDLCCQEIILQYTICILWNNSINYDIIHDVTINQIYIHNYAKHTTNIDDISGLHIELDNTIYHVNMLITNSQFYNMRQKALKIKISSSAASRNIFVTNCIFQSNIAGPAVIILASPYNKNITFTNCKFLKNRAYFASLIIIHINERTAITKLFLNTVNRTFPLIATNISFIRCEFKKNTCGLLIIRNMHSEVTLLTVLFKSLNISNNAPKKPKNTDMITINSIKIKTIGPINIINNYCKRTIIKFKSCDILFSGKIIFDTNYCSNVISLNTHIKVMEYSTVSFANNRYQDTLISVESTEGHYYQPYQFCLFQYIAKDSKMVTRELLFHYDITINHNDIVNSTGFRLPSLNNYCSMLFCHFTSHCKWITSAAFYNYTPEAINKQIIQNDDQNCNYHKHICHCSSKEINCSIDTLGSVYPGQTLQTNICNMCSNENTTVLYAEVHNVNLPSSSCKIAHQSQLVSVIGNHSHTVNYTIVSSTPNSNRCELFLTASPFLNTVYDAFYVQLLPCPVGFTLQDGVCDCDPVLPANFDTCYVDHSAIRRPASTWITAHSQANNTKYLISDCPMDYCLPYPSNINLFHPDLQCQFNRTGILCSQCQHHLSMVFGSSRCMKCTNLHILIITIIVIVAGVVLVVLLYLFNLTVTNGTISGIIFYSNIVSINDSVFLVNDNVFKPLSTNLDLGIETCFYNGMDSYAKMWLQLFFPLHLIIIAVSIIIASRYSSRILRLTYTRSLPVLATLFLLSYTGVLRTVLTVLFSYSTITHLPSGHKQIVWSIDASVPLFGLKFTILFITCLVLFLLLIPFNITLLFTRHLLQFRIINQFKPLLDAFQGSYKDKYFYWVAVHITLRSIYFSLHGFQINLRLIIATMILVLFTAYHGYTRPYKNKLVNIQELLLLINLTIMYAVSYQCSESIFSIVTNVMISLAFIQFCTIVLYHFLTYTCHCDVAFILQTRKQKMIKCLIKNYQCQNLNNIELLNIPECTYNYSEFQDGLVSGDFK